MNSALLKQPVMLGRSRVIIGDIAYVRLARQRFNFRSRRAFEIDALCHHRHHTSLPSEAQAQALAIAIASVAEPNQAAQWIRRWCAALDEDEQQDIVADAARKPRKWKAPAMGELLELTIEERALLGIRTFRAVGVTRRQMRKNEMERDQDRKRAARAKAREGKPPSIEKQRPWEAVGVSRATWYRRRASGETEPAETESVRNILPTISPTETVSPYPPQQSASDEVAGRPPGNDSRQDGIERLAARLAKLAAAPTLAKCSQLILSLVDRHGLPIVETSMDKLELRTDVKLPASVLPLICKDASTEQPRALYWSEASHGISRF